MVYFIWFISFIFFFLIFQGIQIPLDSDIHALSTLEDVQYAIEHGVYVINKEKVCEKENLFLFSDIDFLFFLQNIVTNILYRASMDELNKYANDDHKVPTVGKMRRKTN